MTKKKKPAKKRPAPKPLSLEQPTPKQPANPQAAKAASPAKEAAAAPAKPAPGKQKGDGLRPSDPAVSSKANAPNKAGANKESVPQAGVVQEAIKPPKSSAPKPSPEDGSRDADASSHPVDAGLLEAAKPLQNFASEMQRMAKQSIEQTTEVMERLRDARTVEEVVALQTTFMQQSFRRYTEIAGRIGELMTSSQVSLFQQGQAAMRSFRSIASGP